MGGRTKRRFNASDRRHYERWARQQRRREQQRAADAARREAAGHPQLGLDFRPEEERMRERLRDYIEHTLGERMAQFVGRTNDGKTRDAMAKAANEVLLYVDDRGWGKADQAGKPGLPSRGEASGSFEMEMTEEQRDAFFAMFDGKVST